MYTVYLHGSYFGNNFGDVLLVDIFASRIKKLGFNVCLPFADEFYKKEIACGIGKCANEDKVVYAIFCGGGYFGEPGSRKKYWSWRNSYRHARAYYLFRRNNIPYGIFGVGFGPISHQPFLGFAKKIFTNAQYACVRDPDSRDFLESYAVSAKVDVFADAVISLRESDIPISEVAKETTFVRSNDNQYFVGVHLTNKYADASAFENIKKALAMFASQHPEAHFILISDGTSRTGKPLQQERDALNIAKMLPPERVIYARYKRHWQMVALINKLDMVVTSKLHVGIVASALGRNVLSIPYHSKTVRFYRQINQPDRCLVDEVSQNSVFELLNDHYRVAGVHIPDEIREVSEKNFEKLAENLAKFAKERTE